MAKKAEPKIETLKAAPITGRPLTEAERDILFPTRPPLTLKQLKERKNKKA